MNWLILASGGLLAGLLAGFLGIGGGTVLVPLLLSLGYAPVQAVASSSLAILLTSVSGSLQNLRMGYFNPSKVILLGTPAILSTQLGAFLASRILPHLLLIAFGLLLLLNIYLFDLRQRIGRRHRVSSHPHSSGWNPLVSRSLTGGVAGLMAGLFGLGGGVIMVPLQILLLGEPLKVAIQTSLGVIMITGLSASLGHALAGNILFLEGVILGVGGLLGAQISTRYLPKLPEAVVSLMFRAMLGILASFIFWQAWESYGNS